MKEFLYFITHDVGFNWVLYAVLIIPSFLIWWVFLRERLKNRRIQAIQHANKESFIHDIKFTLVSLMISNMFYFVMDQLEKKGITKIYFNIDDYSLGWLVFSLFLVIFIHETYFYWLHRAMHHRLLYPYFHQVHHRSTDPSPLTSYAFHPLEAILEHGIVFLLIFIIPLNIYVLIAWLLLQQFFNMVAHLGYEIYPAWWLNNSWFNWKATSTHHNMHHELFHGNYGFYFTFWDKWCGTEFTNYHERYEEIFDRNLNNPVEEKWHSLQIEEIKQEHPGTISLYFKPTNPAFLNFKAGQQVTMRIKVKNEYLYRTYSIASIPQIDQHIRLTIKKMPEGMLTPFLFNHLRCGDLLELSLPNGKFHLKPNHPNETTQIFIAAGIGITPIYSMIGSEIFNQSVSQVRLLYFSKNEASLLYKTDFTNWEKQYPEKFKTWFCVERRITKSDLMPILEGISYNNIQVYLCAPLGFRNSVKTWLIEMGLKQTQIMEESYQLNSTIESHVASSIKVTIQGNTYSFQNREEETLLESALKSGIPLKFACRSGICGTCKLHCLSGEVSLINNQCLSDNEIKQGKILACQAIPLSTPIELSD